MPEAIFGLVGVIVGVVLAGAIEWVRSARERKLAGRVAALILADELTKALVDIDFLLSHAREISREDSIRAESCWGEHREALAAVVGDDEFLRVSFAVSSVKRLGECVRADAGGYPADPDAVLHQREHVREAAETLWRYGGREPRELREFSDAQDAGGLAQTEAP